MAAPTLITKLSRRAMLARGALAAALFPAAARASATPFGGPDGPLLERVALAELFWTAYARAEADCDRLYQALRRHPDCPPAAFDTPETGAAWDGLAARLGIPAQEARCLRLSALCDSTTRAAFDLPARSLQGARAKLRLALTVLKAEHRGHLDPPDCSYLDATLADLESLATG